MLKKEFLVKFVASHYGRGKFASRQRHIVLDYDQQMSIVQLASPKTLRSVILRNGKRTAYISQYVIGKTRRLFDCISKSLYALVMSSSAVTGCIKVLGQQAVFKSDFS